MRTRILAAAMSSLIVLSILPATNSFCQVRPVVTRPAASGAVPAPEEVLGFRPGDDRKLASWNQIVSYFEKLDRESDRVQFQTLGHTTMNARFVMATISTPENLARLDEYRSIQDRLADPAGPRAYPPHAP